MQFNSIFYSHYSFYREIKENNINLKEKVIPVERVSLQLKNMCVVYLHNYFGIFMVCFD